MGQSYLESETCGTGEITEELWEKEWPSAGFWMVYEAMPLMSVHALKHASKHASANFSMWGICLLADLCILKTFFYTTMQT